MELLSSSMTGSQLNIDPEIINLVNCRVAEKSWQNVEFLFLCLKLNVYGKDDHSLYEKAWLSISSRQKKSGLSLEAYSEFLNMSQKIKAVFTPKAQYSGNVIEIMV